MKNLNNLISKLFKRNLPVYYTPLILGVFAVVVFVIFIWLQNHQVKPASQQSYQDIFPGTTTVQQAITKLGQPISTSQEGTQTIYKFESGNKYYPHELKTADDKVQLLTQYLTDKPKDNQITKYTQLTKQQPVTLYNQESLLGFNLYVFLDAGIAVKASENKGIGLYILYFPPTDFQTFITRYAPGYTTVLDEKKLYGETHSAPISQPTPMATSSASPSARPRFNF